MEKKEGLSEIPSAFEDFRFSLRSRLWLFSLGVRRKARTVRNSFNWWTFGCFVLAGILFWGAAIDDVLAPLFVAFVLVGLGLVMAKAYADLRANRTKPR